MRLLQMGFDPTAQQQKSLAEQISNLQGDGQTTEPRIHTYPFDDVKGPCCDLGIYAVYQSRVSKRINFKLNRDAFLTESRALIIS